MITEISLFGVFVDVGLVTALLAVITLLVLRRFLVLVSAYRWVWHPPLVDLALFAVLWLLFATLAVYFQRYLADFLG